MSKFAKSKLPYNRNGQWKKENRSDYLLLNISNDIFWFLRLFSPSAWLGAFFQNEENDKYYTNQSFSEVYLIIVTLSLLISLFLSNSIIHSYQIIGVISVLFLIESLQYQFRSLILRPFFQKNYRPYAFERTLIVTLIQYFQIIFVFSIIYRTWFYCDFNLLMGRITSLEFSAITITTVGFGSVHPQPGTLVSLIAAFEGIIGIIYIGIMMAISVSRISSEIKDVASKG